MATQPGTDFGVLPLCTLIVEDKFDTKKPRKQFLVELVCSGENVTRFF